MKKRKNIATTLRDFLNEKLNNLNVNFWKWFGDSVMVENGNPTIFYHFSNEKFSSFEKKSSTNSHLFTIEDVNRVGFFFSTDINFASQYGKEKYEVYLKISNLFDFNKHYYYKDISPISSEFFDEAIEYIEDNCGIDMTMEYQSYIGELKIKPNHIWKFFDGEIGKNFVDYLISKDYDGAFFIEDGSPIYVVFNPNQIKSIENDGSWDTNDNIYS